MAKTTLRQKFGLFFFGLIVTLLFLEAGLRLGGWLFLSLQEQANRRAVGPGQEYRVLCLGESTTALGGENSYPRQLERILNSRQNKIKFKVINKGVPATTTDQILARAEHYLAEYQPQLVVAMMGINDPPQPERSSLGNVLAEKFRTVRLLRMISQHLFQKKKEVQADVLKRKLDAVAMQIDARPSAAAYNKLANLYRSANFPEEELGAILKALALEPLNQEALVLLGIHYERQAEYKKALDAFEKALSQALGVVRLQILTRTAESHKFLGEYQQAEECYLEVLRNIPRHPEAHGALADIYFEEKKYDLARRHYEAQIRINPQAHEAYGKLAHVYRQEGHQDLAEALSQKARSLNTKDTNAGAQNATTKKNYARLYEILRRAKIPLMAAQYPSRSVKPLKEMMAGLDGVIVVDNEKVFREAVARDSYDTYFSDRFSGDFGHCTPEGNALLAGQVADKILAEVLSVK